jgi:uncharacterized repeat protein (TIGR01451 family)
MRERIHRVGISLSVLAVILISCVAFQGLGMQPTQPMAQDAASAADDQAFILRDGSGKTGTAAISPNFFGMTVNNIPAAPWPTTLSFKFTGFRSLGVEIKWSDIEPTCNGGSDPTNSCYTWTNFDYWINEALTPQCTGCGTQDILYVAYWTPSWASSNPTDPNCDHGAFTPGGCDPPNDLNSDGTGTDQHLIDFLTAMMKHLGAGKIKYWCMWNEPDIKVEWKGTNAQLLRMAKDLQATVLAFDPNALFMNPGFTGISGTNALTTYLAAGGGQYINVVDYHGYVVTGTCPTDCPIPENEGPLVDSIRSIMAAYGQQSKPLFDIEGSWGIYNGVGTMTDSDQQAAFTGRFYLMHLSKAVNRFYWFSWNAPGVNGEFYDTTTQQVTSAGTAYKQIYSWTVGAKLTTPCAAVGTSWSCSFTRSPSTAAQALWNTNPSYVCNSGVCPTTNVLVPTNFTQYRTLKGSTLTIKNHMVPVGSKPILVQGPTPGISITKTASASNVAPGSNITYTVTLTNHTANPITSVQVVDNLASALTFQSCSSTGTGTCTVTASKVTISFSSIAAGETDTITLVVTVGSSVTAPVANTATVNWTDANGVAQSNWSTVQVTVGTPQASLSATNLTFSNQPVGTSSTPKTVTVSSVGTGNLVISNIGINGVDGLDFSDSSASLPITIPPGQSTNIDVTFKPSAAGTRSGGLIIYDNTAKGVENVGLHGSGT